MISSPSVAAGLRSFFLIAARSGSGLGRQNDSRLVLGSHDRQEITEARGDQNLAGDRIGIEQDKYARSAGNVLRRFEQYADDDRSDEIDRDHVDDDIVPGAGDRGQRRGDLFRAGEVRVPSQYHAGADVAKLADGDVHALSRQP